MPVLLWRTDADEEGVVALDFDGHVGGEGDVAAGFEVFAFLWAVEA